LFKGVLGNSPVHPTPESQLFLHILCFLQFSQAISLLQQEIHASALPILSRLSDASTGTFGGGCYSYEESPGSEAFFLPLLWSSTTAICSELCWYPKKVSLFDVTAFWGASENKLGGGDEFCVSSSNLLATTNHTVYSISKKL
jgi:hypothetical protein